MIIILCISLTIIGILLIVGLGVYLLWVLQDNKHMENTIYENERQLRLANKQLDKVHKENK